MSVKKKENILLLLLVLMTFVSVAYVLAKHSIRLNPRDNDFRVYYDCSRLMFEGDKTSSSLIMPWAKIVILFLCPAFLPYNFAFWYYYILLTVATIYLGSLIYKWIDVHNVFCEKWKTIILSICIMLLPMNWHDALDMTNLGGAIAIISLIAVFLTDEHPIFASFLLAISMTKPQIVGVFLAMLFFMKKYKPVLLTAMFDAMSWILSSILINIINANDALNRASNTVSNTYDAGDVVSLYANAGESGEVAFFTYGIFDPMKHLGIGRIEILFISAIFGLAIIVAYLYLAKRYRCYLSDKDGILFMGGITSIVSAIWCYKTPCDELVVILSAVIALSYWINSTKRIADVGLVCGFFAAMNLKIFIFWVKAFTGMEHTLGIFCDDSLKLIVMSAMVFLTVQNDKKRFI